MIVTQYICDKCGKTMGIEEAWIVDYSRLAAREHLDCKPSMRASKHLCQNCLNSIFPNALVSNMG